MMHTVNFPIRFHIGHSSAIDITFVDKSRMQFYETFPLSNALSNHEAQCIILNRFFPETKVKNGKHKNKCKVTLIVRETVVIFRNNCWKKPGKMFFSTKDVNSSLKKLLTTFLIIF